ncbi:alpha/beta hydrolase [Actinophytocola xanthii]|uniref:alpha/beta hydrolase n=1 Tax=Actinophytocola xanthii TaxID=1912961 RepID=UPI00117822DC|nr:alpha/beta fold hydrolase [Actinophytocola xanthii]
MPDRTAAHPAGPVRADLVRDGVALAMHTWDDGRADLAGLFYVHGLQSHAGWLFETGPALLDRGVRLVALDRRGSGRSGGPRGHLPDSRTVLDDYAAALSGLADAGPLALLGQSFGASLVAALVATRRVPATTPVVLCAPALGQQRARLDEPSRERVRRSRGREYSAVALEDEQYTTLPGYLRMMANDALMVRSVTTSFRAAMVEVEDRYLGEGPDPWERHPVHVALPERDSIVDLTASLAVLDTLAPHAEVRSFPAPSHYLEFTEARESYWDWLAEVVLAGARC